MRALKRVRDVLLRGDAPEIDPNLLLLDGTDIRAVNRSKRRAHGFRGPAFTGQAPSLPRYIRRHSSSLDVRPVTCRQRKVRARIGRTILQRGLTE